MTDLKNDPTSRLRALERMGVVKDYGKLGTCTVIIVGIGGVGAVVAEMLTRCGIGKLILVDYDDVELANMNRLFYTPKQVGLAKVEAAKQTLNSLNDSVIIEGLNSNICKDYKLFYNKIVSGSMEGSKVDLVLSCVDNYAARVTINKACCQADQIWMNSGVSENATSGQIQTCIPGVTACFLCAPPYIVATNGDESTIKRADVCTASLPTTMGVVAGLLAHNALKYLLEFGGVTKFLSYNSLDDYFPSYTIAYSTECNEKYCLIRQGEKVNLVENVKASVIEEKDEVLHEDNAYNITVVNNGSLGNTFDGLKNSDNYENHNNDEKSTSAVKNLTIKELKERLTKLTLN